MIREGKTTYKRMSVTETVADLLTLSRFVLAVVFPLLGVIGGERALPLVIILIVAGWTTDILDGPLARRGRKAKQTWAGRNDFFADMLMVFASFIYFTQIGIIPLWLFGTYTIVGTLVILRFPFKAMIMALAMPLVALPLVIALYNLPRLGELFLLWIVVALIFHLDSFTRIVTEFIDQFKDKFFSRGIERKCGSKNNCSQSLR